MAIGKISEDLKSAQDYLFKDTVVPANTTTTGTAQLIGGTNGALEIMVTAKTALSITDTKLFTVNLIGSATEGGSFTTVATPFTILAAAGSGSISAGTLLGTYIVTPEDFPWIKAVAITDDVSATGTIDVYIKHLER